MQEEVIKDFLLESQENLASLDDLLANLEDVVGQTPMSNATKQHLQHLYRAVHTLKGSAHILNFPKMQVICHTMENLFELLKSENISTSSSLLATLRESFDFIQQLLDEIEASGVEGEADEKRILEILTLELENEGAVAKELGFGVVDSTQDHVPQEEESNPPEESVEEVKYEEERPAVVKQEENVVPSKGVSESSLKVNIDLLDRIMNRVGELVLNRNQILQEAQKYENSELQKLVNELGLITSDLQTDVMATRMQPISYVLNKFNRMIRDLARENGKKISLVLEGEGTELDKSLIESVRDPLTHIVRNAADHGIETEKERLAAGKSAEGTLYINSFQESGQVVIEIQDDGKGLDKKRIIEKSVEKGIVTEKEVETLSEEKVWELIFHPGMSTAQEVTSISGRGVGMDVVKSNIEGIGGSVQIESRLGKGTTFRLRIPLTLAIVPALVIEDRDLRYAIPQTHLVELVQVRGDKKDPNCRIETLQKKRFLRLRGELISIVKLQEALGLEEVTQEMNSSPLIVIVKAQQTVFGLEVDSILNTEEIVVKSLGHHFSQINHYAGATIMGDGVPALILNVSSFLPIHGEAQSPHTQKKNEEEFDYELEYQENLLFRLSDGRLYAIPLSVVSRLEDFLLDNVERTGELEYIRYQERPMPLLKVSNQLGLKEASKDLSDNFSCIVVHYQQELMGLVVDEIVDIINQPIKVDTQAIARDEFLGTFFLEEKAITLIEPYNLIQKSPFLKNKKRPQGPVKLNGKKILVIDDSSVYRRLEKQALEEHGAEVQLEINGKQALDYLEKDPQVDLIVTDIEMPEMDGFELTQKIRKDSKYKNYSQLPIIAVSTKISEKDLEEGKKSGLDMHLEKFNKKEVVESIISFLNVAANQGAEL